MSEAQSDTESDVFVSLKLCDARYAHRLARAGNFPPPPARQPVQSCPSRPGVTPPAFFPGTPLKGSWYRDFLILLKRPTGVDSSQLDASLASYLSEPSSSGIAREKEFSDDNASQSPVRHPNTEYPAWHQLQATRQTASG